MTDRVNALIVVLDKDYRDDDVESLANAIRCLRGVVSVGKNVSNIGDHVARELARTELKMKILGQL